MTATNAVPVDSSNAEQLRAWDGDEGAYWADHADYFDRSVAAYHERLLDRPRSPTDDRVLDIGCGTGQTTRDAARAASGGSALGVDLSSRMLDHARRRAAEEGLTNATFAQADAQVHPFEPASFDVAISRTAAMFFGDHVAAFRNIGRALRPGGRLRARDLAAAGRRTSGSARSPARSPPAATCRRHRPTPARSRSPTPTACAACSPPAGFTDVELDGTTAGMWFGNDADDAHRFVLGLMGWMLEGLDDAGRARASRRAPRHHGRPRDP